MSFDDQKDDEFISYTFFTFFVAVVGQIHSHLDHNGGRTGSTKTAWPPPSGSRVA